MAGDSTGTTVARTAHMARRVSALIGMAVLVALLTILIWRVYLHHQRGTHADEPAVVSLTLRAA